MKIGLFTRAHHDRPALAIILLLIATFTLACQDALVKLMSAETSFWQIQALRSCLNLCFLVILARFSGGLSLLLPVRGRWVYLRSSFLVVCMFFFFAGAPYLSVTQLAAGLYTYPFFVTILAGPILGEKIGYWRITSIVIGLTGAVLMVAPWDDQFTWIQMLPMIAGLFYAFNILTLRRKCRDESTLALTFVTGLLFLGSGICGIVLLTAFPLSTPLQQAMPFVAIGWPTLTLLILGFAFLASILNLIGNICLARAYQTADASLLAPLDFSYLIFAALWGKILFEHWPTGNAFFGMLLIIGAGMTIAWREQVTSSTKPTGSV